VIFYRDFSRNGVVCRLAAEQELRVARKRFGDDLSPDDGQPDASPAVFVSNHLKVEPFVDVLFEAVGVLAYAPRLGQTRPVDLGEDVRVLLKNYIRYLKCTQ